VIVNMKLIFSPGRKKVRMGMQDLARNDLAEALQAAKLAVRAYARDPSSKNEAGVEEALRRVRRLDSVARWRGSTTVLQATQPAAPGTLENRGFSTYSCGDVAY
jgi:hypothetical protein